MKTNESPVEFVCLTNHDNGDSNDNMKEEKDEEEGEVATKRRKKDVKIRSYGDKIELMNELDALL